MREKDMDEIADAIDTVLSHPTDPAGRKQVRARVRTLCGKFPIFEEYR
jgi:glycine/serine hydroxymethyltransferase